MREWIKAMNKSATASNEYPGRIIIIGQNKKTEKPFVVYAITGRSVSSQARKMEWEEGTIWVKPTSMDLLKKGNTDLLIYPSVFCLSQGIAVSNGKQTVDVMACLAQSESPAEILAFSLKNWDYEPDEPNFTPRISGCLLANYSAALSIIRKAPDGSTLRNIYEFSLVPGKAKRIMTYRGENMDPIPSFAGEPQDIGIEGSTPQEVADMVYGSLAPKQEGQDFRVTVACVFGTDMQSQNFDVHIINRSERMELTNGKIR
jgi:IMP cyclohydrolase